MVYANVRPLQGRLKKRAPARGSTFGATAGFTNGRQPRSPNRNGVIQFGRVARQFREKTPTAFRIRARGCRVAATPGPLPARSFNPNRVA